MCQAHNISINRHDHSANKQHYPMNEDMGVGSFPKLPNLTLLHTSGKLESLKSSNCELCVRAGPGPNPGFAAYGLCGCGQTPAPSASLSEPELLHHVKWRRRSEPLLEGSASEDSRERSTQKAPRPRWAQRECVACGRYFVRAQSPLSTPDPREQVQALSLTGPPRIAPQLSLTNHSIGFLGPRLLRSHSLGEGRGARRQGTAAMEQRAGKPDTAAWGWQAVQGSVYRALRPTAHSEAGPLEVRGWQGDRPRLTEAGAHVHGHVCLYEKLNENGHKN